LLDIPGYTGFQCVLASMGNSILRLVEGEWR
jgi:hypothetical protein